MIKNLIASTFGLNEATFDNRLINIVLFIGVLIGSSSVVVNILSDVNIYTHFINGIVLITYSVMFYFTRFKQKHDVIKLPLVIITILFLDVLWFTSGGLNSPLIFYFYLSSTCFLIFSSSKELWFIGSLSVVNLALVIVLEANTNWVIPYPNENVRFLDVSLSGIVTLILMALLIRWLKINYELERQRAQEKSEKVELLLKELHHRVKNNLQLVSSLLGLQSQKLEDQNAKNAIQLGKDRVRVMGNIHKYLYKEEDSTTINFKEYIIELTQDLKSIYDKSSQVQVDVNMPELKFDADLVLPLGLIINEVFTNALKYAFELTNTPKITLELKQYISSEHEFELLIRDNGIGITDLEAAKMKDSLGMKLIELLTKQLRGSLEINNNPGLEYSLKFNSKSL